MFQPPYDRQAIRAKQSQGSATLLALVDGRDGHAYDEAVQAIFPALIHLGLPYCVRDLADGPLSAGGAAGCAAVVLAQEGVARALAGDEQRLLLDALERGIGLVSFDPRLPAEAPVLAAALGLAAGSERPCALVRTVANDTFVTHTRDVGHELPLIRPVPLLPVAAERAHVPLTDGEGAPVLALGRSGAGRWAHYCLSPKVWLNHYLGHAYGLDDVFWRSIVWTARKPFAMKAMPPYVTIRIDDAQGVGGLWWNVQQCLVRRPLRIPPPIQRLLCDQTPGRDSVAYGFQYIDVFNRHGIIPAVGIYLDQVSREDRAILKRYHDAGKVELSAHAFSEYTSLEPLPPSPGRDTEEHRVTEFIYHRGWHREPDGRYVIDEHTPEELRHNFERVDRFWAEAGIRPSRVVNSHYVNPGANSLPFLKARGQDMVMFAATFGGMYDSHYKAPWSRAPYGSIGLVFDYMPVPEGVPGVAPGDFFCAEAHVYNARQLATTGRVSDSNIDFTVGSTMKGCGRDDNDLREAADNIVYQVRVGLDSLFFGCMMAHEQGLAVLTAAELDEVLSLSERALARYDVLFASYEHIAEYARCKVDTHLERVERRDGALDCRLSGRATLPLKLYYWTDEGEGCRYRFDEVPPFAGGHDTTLG